MKYATKDEGDVAIQSLHNVRTMAPSAALMQVCNFSIAAYVTSCASGLSLSGAFLSFFGSDQRMSSGIQHEILEQVTFRTAAVPVYRQVHY